MRDTIRTYRDLKEAEYELSNRAKGMIGGVEDFVAWAHHELDERMPFGLSVYVAYDPAGQYFSLGITDQEATLAKPCIEVDDRT